MKHTVRFNDGAEKEFDADNVAIQPPGLFVLVKDKDVVATFSIGNIAGIWPTDGPSQVKLAPGGVTL